jgi:hypothetical protein
VIDVAGRTAQAARKFADNLGIERATGNYQDLLADADVSVVHTCAPNDLHYAMANSAMQAGKRLLCEKPLVSTVAEASSMVALANQRGWRIAPCTTCARTPRCRICAACAERVSSAISMSSRERIRRTGFSTSRIGTGASNKDGHAPLPTSGPTGAT